MCLEQPNYFKFRKWFFYQKHIDYMKVLIIDDHPLMIKTLEIKMRKEGYDVISCTDGRDALSKLEIELPDVVITEVMLPSCTDFEVISAAKKLNYNAIVVVVSVIGVEKIITEAFELGADDYITKPVNLNLLAVRIRRLLKNKHQMELLAKSIPAANRKKVLMQLAELEK